MKAAFLSYAFPPLAAPRAVQVARLAKYSSLPIRLLCAGNPTDQPTLRTGVELMRFPDKSSRWWRRAKHFLYVPDSERPWAESAARIVLNNKLVAADDVLVTFGQPMSDHIAGLKLKRRLGVPWIAHFSDPWSDSPYLSRNPLLRRRLRRMERQVVAAADRLMFTSDETVDLVMCKYPPEWRRKVSVLPHAYDPEYVVDVVETAPPAGRRLILRHIGNFYGPRNPVLLTQALRLLLKTQPALLNNVTVELVGRWVGNEGWSPAETSFPDTLLVARKPVEYRESLRQMCTADALLIVDAPFEHNVFFPSKLVEYLWARKPILALTPEGPSAQIVTECGGIVASPQNAQSIAAGLADLIGRLRSGTISAPKEQVVARYDARRVAAEFDRVVNGLISDARARAGRNLN
jgi:glycosyltransferase involved in cell wall biosynthesis